MNRPWIALAFPTFWPAWPTPTFTDGVFQTTIDGLGPVVLLSLSDPRQVVGAIMFVLEANEDAIPADQLAILGERAAQLGPLVSLRSLYGCGGAGRQGAHRR